jgi:WD40 repeat protein
MMKLIAIASHTTPVNVVKINEDGDLCFSASNDKEDTTVCLFYSHSGERIGSFKCRAAVKSIDVSRNSKYLVTMSSIGDIEIWLVNGGLRIGTMVMDKRRSRYI